MKTRILSIAALCGSMIFGFASKSSAQAISEGFDNVGTLAGNGWFQQLNGTPVGLQTTWGQGDVAVFNAQSGATNSYIFANFQMVSGNNTISSWLLTPNRTFKNGDVITFYTRKPIPAPTDYPDRLQVRMSTNGASTNVGTGAAGIGDFTTMLLEINASQAVGGYPTAWTQYTITISGLPAPTSGRVAFRYYVTGGGPTGSNSDFIGIDNFVYTPYTCPAFTMTPGGALTGGTAGSAYSTTLTQTGALGAPTFAVTAGALPPGMTLAANGTISGTPTATGTFNFTSTVSDASGCSGSTAYSITVVCPSNPTTLNGLPTLCSNNSPVTLTQGSPAGGTYSGTGVSAGMFDPSAGTQSITYDYTDAYGCAHSTTNTITVNTAPTVSQSAISAVCDNSGMLALTGGSPAGGTYSGTGVSGGNFDPMSGSQTVTYTYTDGNSCSNTATTSITVNAAPTVTQSAISAVCDNSGMLTLTGGSPAGGTYSGTGVTGTDFDPAAGTQTVSYTYTDGNSCSNTATTSITVNTAPTVSQNAFTAVCMDAADVTLTGGSPAGGTYSGTGVTGGMFDPSSGTQTITYEYTDANGCMNMDTESFSVNPLPTVTLAIATDELCVYNNAITLSGGSPAGGSYSGNGVTAGSFDPATAGLGASTITYTYADANGCDNTATDVINVDQCLGVEDISNVNITVSPNPSAGVFVINGVDLAQFNNLMVQDLNGRIVKTKVQTVDTNNFSVSLEGESTGVYLLSGEYNNQIVSIRLVKN